MGLRLGFAGVALSLLVSGAVPLRAADPPAPPDELARLRQRLDAQEAELRSLRDRLTLAPSPPSTPLLERLPPQVGVDSTDMSAAKGGAPPAADPPDDWKSQISAQLKKLQAAEDKRRELALRLPTATFTTELQADNYYFGQDENSIASVGDIPDGSAFRRARIGWYGDHNVTDYRIEFDFALQGRPSFLDVYAGVNDLPVLNYVRVGHFFEPFSLERMTANRFVTFMERSLPDQPFAPARNLGIATSDMSEDEMMTWAYGVFAANSNAFGDQQSDSDETAFTARVTRLLWYDEPALGRYWFHLGCCYSIREPNLNMAQFQSQPEARLGGNFPNAVPFFVNTGLFPAHFFQLFDLEMAWVNGPFSLQSEYFFVPVDRMGGPDPFFSSFYVTASYILTGEHRPYRRRWGTFDRVQPLEPFFRVRADDRIRTGMGAWEIAMRISHLDLTDDGIEGGRLTDLTIGLNWYMTNYLRFTSNYIHAFLDNPTFGNSGTDIFGMRIQYDF